MKHVCKVGINNVGLHEQIFTVCLTYFISLSLKPFSSEYRVPALRFSLGHSILVVCAFTLRD